MKKSTTTAGPTGLSRVRSLLAFRHQNPLARLVSMIAAFAIAMLLVGGTGAAYADDPAPTDTTTVEPSGDPTVEESPAADDTGTPAAEETASSDAGDGADAPDATPADGGDSKGDAKSDGGAKSDTAAPAADSGPMMTTLKTLASDPVPQLVGNAACEPGTGTLVGGFQIDGDPCAEGGLDFDNAGSSVDDPYQTNNDNIFSGGDSENDDPATWGTVSGQPTGKADIGTFWAYSHTWNNLVDPSDPTNGHVFAYFGFTNDSTSGGTQDYSLEYNQADPDANGMPVRTPGDLLFHFFSNGSAPLVFEAAYIYTEDSDPAWDDATCVESGTLGAGWCPFEPPGPLTLADIFVSDASATGEFVEGAIDLTLLFGEGNCSDAFRTTFLRSAPGAFFTSQLKDYVAPLNVPTPSTCGSLTVHKTDAVTDLPVEGAVFGFDPDPRPGGDPGDVYCVFDGVAADMPAKPAVCDIYVADGFADGTVEINPAEPGDYTVTELVAPPGYLLDPTDNSESVTVGEPGEDNHDAVVTFTNHKQWQPLDVSKTATGHNGAQYFWTVNKEIAPTADGPWSDGTTPADPLVKNDDGTDTSLYYRVVVTEDHVETSNFVVDGTITVHNPNDASVTATIHESLDNCVIDGGAAGADITRAVAPDVNGVGTTYSYSCDLGDGPVDAGTNTATVTWDRSDYPQTEDDLLPANADEVFTDDGSDGYTFDDVSTIDETVTVEDDHFTFDPAWIITWGDEDDGVYESDVYSVDTGTAAGTCSEVITNTVTVTGDDAVVTDGDGHPAQDSESGQVCVGADLTATIDDSESLTRTFPWSIQKATTTPNVTVTNGAASATYDVTVTAGAQEDSDWHISGVVTVSNPNDWEDVPLTGLSVSYSGSNDANTGDDCVVTESLASPIPAGGSRTFHYNCTFSTQPDYDGTVDAAVTWDAAAANTPHGVPVAPVTTAVAEADWNVTEVDSTVTVHDDQATGQDIVIATLDWATVYAMDQHRRVIHYTVSLTGLPAAGSCNTKVNTVWIVGHDLVHLDADENSANNMATVQVCTPAIVVLPPKPPQQPHPHVLPNTGGPNAWVFAAGLALLLSGGALVLADQRRKRRS